MWYLHCCLLDLCSGKGFFFLFCWVFFPLAQRKLRSNFWATLRVNSAAASLKNWVGTVLAEVEQSHAAPGPRRCWLHQTGERMPWLAVAPALLFHLLCPLCCTLPCRSSLSAAGTALWGSCLPGRALTPSRHYPTKPEVLLPGSFWER